MLVLLFIFWLVLTHTHTHTTSFLCYFLSVAGVISLAARDERLNEEAESRRVGGVGAGWQVVGLGIR